MDMDVIPQGMVIWKMIWTCSDYWRPDLVSSLVLVTLAATLIAGLGHFYFKRNLRKTVQQTVALTVQQTLQQSMSAELTQLGNKLQQQLTATTNQVVQKLQPISLPPPAPVAPVAPVQLEPTLPLAIYFARENCNGAELVISQREEVILRQIRKNAVGDIIHAIQLQGSLKLFSDSRVIIFNPQTNISIVLSQQQQQHQQIHTEGKDEAEDTSLSTTSAPNGMWFPNLASMTDAVVSRLTNPSDHEWTLYMMIVPPLNKKPPSDSVWVHKQVTE
jgi:hypothetical protein